MSRRIVIAILLACVVAIGCKDSSTKSANGGGGSATTAGGPTPTYSAPAGGDTIHGPMPRVVTPTDDPKK